MTLGGLAIALGELVDDAVVDVENIFRHLRENRALEHPKPAFDVIVAASQEVRSGIVYATAIIVLVFVPLFCLVGIEGRLFAPLGEAYIISILASLLVSITLTPVMSYYMLPHIKRLDRGDSALVRVLKRGNAALLERAFRHQRALLAMTLLAVTVAGSAAFFLPRSFLPPFNEDTLTINMLFNPGISLARSSRVGLLRTPHPGCPGRESSGDGPGAPTDEHAEACIPRKSTLTSPNHREPRRM
jgi:HME family heavy-metal exporter